MIVRGEFVINGKPVPNIIVDEGEEAFLRMIVEGSAVDLAPGADFYFGLTTDIGVANDATLADLGELLVQNGYARKPIVRAPAGWPVIQQITGFFQAQSVQVQFTAAGGDFNAAYTRAFLCNVAAGTAGKLFAISGRLDEPFLLTDGNSVNVSYNLYLGYQ